MGKIVKNKDYADQMGLDDLVDRDTSPEMEVAVSSSKVLRPDVHAASKEAQKILDDARQEAQRIKQQAREILSRVEAERDRSKAQGFEEGREEGLAEATELIAGANHRKEAMFVDMERDVVRLIYDIAEKVIGSELAQNPDAILSLIREALGSSMGQKVIILVNPQDFEVVRNSHSQLLQTLDSSKTLQIRSDDKVKPHGCRIETEIGTIDAQLEVQLAAVQKALGIHP